MFENDYLKRLKEYYETEYNGIFPSDTAEKFAKQMISSHAEIVEHGEPFDEDEMFDWIISTLESVDEEWEENADVSETLDRFPGLYGKNGYKKYCNEIAAYFLLRDLENVKKEIENENEQIIKRVTELNWIEMIESNPTVQDIFIF